jgi:hypothetical protein
VADAACAHAIFGILVAAGALPVEDHASTRCGPKADPGFRRWRG